MIICRNSGIDEASLGNEKVMMNIDAGKYYGLNQIGSKIWSIIENPVSTDEVVNILQGQYDVDRGTCEKSVEEFFNILEKENLIKITL